MDNFILGILVATAVISIISLGFSVRTYIRLSKEHERITARNEELLDQYREMVKKI